MNIAIIIPARGGSKRIPGKNMKVLGDAPLLSWTMSCASQFVYEFRTQVTCDWNPASYVSTDDPAIYGFCFDAPDGNIVVLRPDALAQDDTPTLAVIQHHLREMPEVDICVVLQPTNPFRKPESVIAAIEKLIAAPPETDAVISVSPVRQHPKHMYMPPMFMSDPFAVSMRYTMHQPAQPIYHFNGAIVVARREKLLAMQHGWGDNVILHEISQTEAIDIDDELDWMLAEKVAEGK